VRFVVNSAVAFLFSNLTAYLMNAAWVFEPGRHSRGMEVVLFFGVSAVSVAVGAGVGWGLIRWLHWSTTVSYVSKIVASLLVNYAGRKWFVFLADSDGLLLAAAAGCVVQPPEPVPRRGSGTGGPPEPDLSLGIPWTGWDDACTPAVTFQRMAGWTTLAEPPGPPAGSSGSPFPFSAGRLVPG
jgi:hypothetical protein